MSHTVIEEAPLQGMERQEVLRLRADFPVLSQLVYDKPLAYLDNAATTQKPRVVIDRIADFYAQENGTVRRGVYQLSERSTQLFDEARVKVARFLNAASPSEIVFTRGTTEAINLVAATFGRQNVQAGDEVLITAMEHHANLVPWQQLCLEKRATLKVVPISDEGVLDVKAYSQMLNPKVKILAITHVSNALGTINPIKELIAQAHAHGIPVLVDGAQSAPHMLIDLQDLDCDFYAFSGHKLYGPTGIGVLYGKMRHLESMPPYQFGGDMISSVSFEKTTFAKPPNKFEAGTPAIAEVIGLGAAIDYLQQVGLERISAYEDWLLQYATEQLRQVPGIRFVGTAPSKAGLVSFILNSAHPHDIGTILDREGVAVRAGHHCAQPVMARFGLPATVRASFSFYNVKEDIDALIRGLHLVNELFA